MEKEPEIKVSDKRRFNTDGSTKEDQASQEEEKKTEEEQKETPQDSQTQVNEDSDNFDINSQAFELNFTTFILSLASSVQISLGLAPNPLTNQAETNLPSAKQTIDILGIIEEKTKGNLSEDEDRLLKQVLYELRMNYVEVSKS